MSLHFALPSMSLIFLRCTSSCLCIASDKTCVCHPWKNEETNAKSSLLNNFQNQLENKVGEGLGVQPTDTHTDTHTLVLECRCFPFQIKQRRNSTCLLVPLWCHLFVQVWVESKSKLYSLLYSTPVFTIGMIVNR